jgi:hypothetical protein
VGALIGVHGFQINGVAQDVIFLRDAIAAMDVARFAGDGQRLAAIVALHQRDGLGHPGALIQQTAQLQRALKAQRDFSLHVGELLLNQLRAGNRLAEDHALHGVIARRMPAKFRRTHRAPGNTVARLVQAAERTAQTLHMGQDRVVRDKGIIERNRAGGGGAQAQLAVNLRTVEALNALVHDKAADFAIQLGPDHRQIRDRRVGDPHFRAIQDVSAIDLPGRRAHRTWIRPAIRFGQAKAAHPLTGGELGQIFLLLLFRAESLNRIHHQRRLDAHGRAIATVDGFDLPRDQTVGDVGQASPAILFGHGGAQKAQLTHLGHDGAIKAFLAIGLDNARQQLFAAILARGL